MAKNDKKKPGTGAPEGVQQQSDYKSREADARPGQTDVAFQKAFGKKDASRKG